GPWPATGPTMWATDPAIPPSATRTHRPTRGSAYQSRRSSDLSRRTLSTPAPTDRAATSTPYSSAPVVWANARLTSSTIDQPSTTTVTICATRWRVRERGWVDPTTMVDGSSVEPRPDSLTVDISDLLGHVAAVDEPHDLVAEVGRSPEHQWTTPIDHGDPVLPAVARRRRRDAACARTAMHPYVPDAELCTLAHRVLRELGSCRDDHCLDSAGDRLQIGIGSISLDLLGLGVDREDRIAALAEPSVHGVAAVVLGRAGDPRHSHSLHGQER